jgi:hypothetical protein
MSRLRPRLTFSNVISVIALFVALGGSGYVAVKLKRNQVKSKHIAAEAVQGVDANESTFSKVPSAAQSDVAANATNAANAATLDGLGPGDLQFGDGADDAAAGVVEAGEIGGITVFEGGVGVDCGSSPVLVYEDIPGDPFVTDLWVDGAHQEVDDGDAAAPVPLSLTDTAQVHVWGGGGTVAHVVATLFYDSSPEDCRLAFTSQENLDTGASVTSAAAGRNLDRGGLPDGWVEPSRAP